MRPKPHPPSRGADEGWAVLSTLISGFVLFGGIGWLLDQWWGTRLMTPIGLIVGMSLGIYAVVMQFGRPGAERDDTIATTSMGTARSVQKANEADALRAAKAVNRAKAVSRARAAQLAASSDAMAVNQARPAPPAHSPNEGPPPASTRRETECL